MRAGAEIAIIAGDQAHSFGFLPQHCAKFLLTIFFDWGSR